MYVRIDKISAAGCRFDQGVSTSRLNDLLAESETGYHAVRGVDVDVRLFRAGARIVVEGTLETVVQCPCRRCLENVVTALPRRFRMDLLPEEDRHSEPIGADDAPDDDSRDGSFSMQVADRDYYQGEAIDMWPILREQLLLALPEYVLCDDACKGLCQACGVDLNGHSCGCDRTVVDPRLAGLSKIKLT